MFLWMIHACCYLLKTTLELFQECFLEEGDYYVVVDGYDIDEEGHFELRAICEGNNWICMQWCAYAWMLSSKGARVETGRGRDFLMPKRDRGTSQARHRVCMCMCVYACV